MSCSIWGIDEDTNGNLFAGVYTRGDTVANARIYRSTDAGATWVSVYYGGSTVRHVHDIAVDKSNNYIYASIGDKYLSWTAYVIRSIDGGNNWSQILTGIPQVVAIETIPGARLFGTDDPMSGNGRIFKTTDDTNYQQVLDTGADSYGLWFRTNPLNGRIYASFVSGEHSPTTAWIYTSDNNGLNWQIYQVFHVSTAYYGSPWASNFVQGTMYYSVRLNSGWQNGIKIYPSFLGASYPAYDEGKSKLNLPSPQTFYNDIDSTLASNDSSAFPPSADLPQLSLNETSWLPLSLGTVVVSTVLPIDFIKPKRNRFFSVEQKVGSHGYRFQGSNHNSKSIVKGR